MKASKPFICALTAAMVATPVASLAADDDELQYEEAQVYFELNDTDGDLGLHGKVDGDGWEKVRIEGPNDRTFLDLEVKSGLRRQGMTELFFESSEPTFDELDPEVFFPRFPEGGYDWEGKTLDNDEIEGEAWLSHIIPAAPVVATVGGSMENPGFEIDEEEDEVAKACWEVTPDGNGDVVVSWYAVEKSHADTWNVDPQPLLAGEDLRYGGEGQPERKIPLGAAGELPQVLYYEFVAEVDDTVHKMTAVVPADITSWTIPAEFLALSEGEVKFEIIVRIESGGGLDDDGDEVESGPGNQSAVEDCFEFEV